MDKVDKEEKIVLGSLVIFLMITVVVAVMGRATAGRILNQAI